jgi:plasmid stabilization system protein ParE
VKVTFSAQAKWDLVEIGDYIAKDSPRRATEFVAKIEAKALQLGDAPRGFPLVPRYEHHGIRRRPFRDHVIFYRVGTAQIDIVHILHSAQDYESILFSGE